MLTHFGVGLANSHHVFDDGMHVHILSGKDQVTLDDAVEVQQIINEPNLQLHVAQDDGQIFFHGRW